MDKKEALLSILRELFWIFHLAERLYEYVRDSVYDENTIDWLIGLFRNEIESVANGEQKKFFESVLERLELMRQREIVDIEKDREEAFRILHVIS